jgi:hypothetical protein
VLARRLEVGNISVNGGQALAGPVAPFGGVKERSGSRAIHIPVRLLWMSEISYNTVMLDTVCPEPLFCLLPEQRHERIPASARLNFVSNREASTNVD